jgi:hypothetical protein
MQRLRQPQIGGMTGTRSRPPVPATRLPGLGSVAPGREHGASWSPETARAEASYRLALVLANELGMRPLQAHYHRGLGTLYAKIGHLAQARAECSIAIALYRALEITFWLPRPKQRWHGWRGSDGFPCDTGPGGEPPPQPWACLLSSAHDPVWPYISASLLRERA